MKIPKFLMVQEAEVEVYLGDGAYGPVWDEPKIVECYVEPKNRLVRDQNGNEIMASARGFFYPDTNISTNSRVTWEGNKYTVIEAVPYQFFKTKSHIEVVMALGF